jgi:hypothetical protein
LEPSPTTQSPMLASTARRKLTDYYCGTMDN